MEGLRIPRLYAWQAEALESWVAAGRRGIVEAVTGTGKTMLGVQAIADAVSDGRRAAVLVPTKELQTQWRGVLRRALPGPVRIGLLGDGERATLRSHDVVVSIVNSARGGELLPTDGAALVADECHRYASEVNRLALDPAFDWRLGLTATLERPDRMEQEIIPYFESTVYEMGYERAIADEVTAHFRVALLGVAMSPREAVLYEDFSRRIRDLMDTLLEEYGLPSFPFHRFMAEVRRIAEGPWHPAQRYARAFQAAVFERKTLMAISPSKRRLVGELEHALRKADRTLVFTDSIESAESIADDLDDRGLAVDTVHSEQRPADRRAVLAAFGAGRLQVVVAPRVLDEGVDVPAADLAVIVAASKTRRQMIQRMGRVLRRKADDRVARFAILYLKGTTEDPGEGAHEAFLSEITSVADGIASFDAGNQMAEAATYLCDLSTGSPPGPPRFEGDPARPIPERHTTDVEADTAAFLGVTTLGAPPPPVVPVAPVSPTSVGLAARTGRAPVVSSSGRNRPEPKDASASPRRTSAMSDVRRKIALDERRQRIMTAYRSNHGYLSVLEVKPFRDALPSLMERFADAAILEAQKYSADAEVISNRLEWEVRRAAQLSASARLIDTEMPRVDRPDAPARRRGRRATRTSSLGPKRAAGAAAGERPHYQVDPDLTTRFCPACEHPEETCSCG